MEVSQKEIQILEKQASPLIKNANSYKVASVEDVDSASIILKKLRDTERMIDTKRKEFTQPLNKSLKAINATFKEIIKPLATARGILTKKVIDWKNFEMERLEKEEARRRRIQESHRKVGHEVKAPVVMERLDTTIGNTRTRKVWTFEIVDFKKVPDTYKMINNSMVRADIRNGTREVSGLKIYQKEQLSIVGR